MTIPFDYSVAFGRNLGILREDEQARVRGATVALAGLGGAGGAHLQALLRLGVGMFHLADPERFELANFNRQWGATLRSIGRSKAETMADLARQINPEVHLRLFPDGVTQGNAAAFLDGASVAVDAIDFFNLGARRMLLAECRRRSIPAVLSAPVGFGASVLVFPPAGASFEEHFGLQDDFTRTEQLMSFAVGLGFLLADDVDLSRVNATQGKGPAVGPSCLLAAGLTAVEVAKRLCKRVPLPDTPCGVFCDPLRGRMVPLQRVPNLRDSETGRAIRESFFRKLPALKLMHERELGLQAVDSEVRP